MATRLAIGAIQTQSLMPISEIKDINGALSRTLARIATLSVNFARIESETICFCHEAAIIYERLTISCESFYLEQKRKIFEKK